MAARSFAGAFRRMQNACKWRYSDDVTLFTFHEIYSGCCTVAAQVFAASHRVITVSLIVPYCTLPNVGYLNTESLREFIVLINVLLTRLGESLHAFAERLVDAHHWYFSGQQE